MGGTTKGTTACITDDNNDQQGAVKGVTEANQPGASRTTALFNSLNGWDKSANNLSDNNQSINQDSNDRVTADTDMTPNGLQSDQPENIDG